VHAFEGRSDDLVVMQDGRLVGRLDTVFKHGAGIAEAQLIQETFTRFRLKYVPAGGASAASVEGRLLQSLQDYLGVAVEVVFDRVDQIPRSAQGKFRAVVSELSPTQRQQVAS
jgi:phenylacetate-CoA ligase